MLIGHPSDHHTILVGVVVQAEEDAQAVWWVARLLFPIDPDKSTGFECVPQS